MGNSTHCQLHFVAPTHTVFHLDDISLTKLIPLVYPISVWNWSRNVEYMYVASKNVYELHIYVFITTIYDEHTNVTINGKTTRVLHAIRIIWYISRQYMPYIHDVKRQSLVSKVRSCDVQMRLFNVIVLAFPLGEYIMNKFVDIYMYFNPFSHESTP